MAFVAIRSIDAPYSHKLDVDLRRIEKTYFPFALLLQKFSDGDTEKMVEMFGIMAVFCEVGDGFRIANPEARWSLDYMWPGRIFIHTKNEEDLIMAKLLL
jgi:hypothetical protein